MISTDYVDLVRYKSEGKNPEKLKKATSQEGYWELLAIQNEKEIKQNEASTDVDLAQSEHDAVVQKLTGYYTLQTQAQSAADALAVQEASVLSELSASDETVGALNESKNAAQATLTGFKTDKDNLENQKSSELNTNSIKIAGINSKIDSSKRVVAAKDVQYNNLSNTLTSKNTTLSSLQQELSTAESTEQQVDENGNTVSSGVDTASLEAQIEELENEIAQIEQEMETIQAEKDAENEKIAGFEQELAAAQQEKQNITTKYNELISSKNNEINQAENEVTNISSALEENLQTNYNINLKAAEVSQKRVEATTFLTSVGYMIQVAEAELVEKENALSDAQDKEDEAIEEYNTAEANTKKLEEDSALKGGSLRLVA